MGYSREIAKERKERLNQIIKVKVQYPNLNKTDLVKIIEDKYGVSMNTAYEYLRDVDDQLLKIEDNDLIRRRNLLLQKVYDVYKLSKDDKNYNVCASMLKLEASILGLNKVTVFAQQTIENNVEINNEVNLQQNIVEMNDIDEEGLNKLIEEVKAAGISIRGSKSLLHSKVDKVHTVQANN
jgi:hypothetical protein